MTARFLAVVRPRPELADMVASLTPTNPFYTAAYTSGREAAGEIPCVFAIQDDTVVTGCTGFLRGHVLGRILEITSLPWLSEPDIFWDGLYRFCRGRRVWDLHVESFASEATSIPHLSGEASRRERCEYRLDLTAVDLLANASANHRRNIARARKAGLGVQRTRDVDACRDHLRLMTSSMERRHRRGESVAIQDGTRTTMASLLASQAAELFLAVRTGEPLSSILVLRAAAGGYYQSAGTSPDGLALGASPFLIAEVAHALKEEGLRVFNLGGAGPDNPGLQRFKAGFGARTVALQAASFSVASPLLRKLRAGARRALRHPAAP